MRVHRFDEKLEQGQRGEEWVAAWLSRWGEVSPAADMRDQRNGIDLYLRTAGRLVSVEVKTDFSARATGNAYVETVSVQREGGAIEKRGWLWTCKADRLVYFVPRVSVSVLDPAKLRDIVQDGRRKFRQVKAQNVGYYGAGLLVPLPTFYKMAMYNEML